MLGRQQERQDIEFIHLLGEDTAEIRGYRIRRRCSCGLHSLLQPAPPCGRYFFATAPLHLCVIRLTRYLLRTPQQEKRAPSFMISSRASSPSRLITVALLRSTTSLRPSRFWFAVPQLCFNSATQGSISLPSTTSR